MKMRKKSSIDHFNRIFGRYMICNKISQYHIVTSSNSSAKFETIAAHFCSLFGTKTLQIVRSSVCFTTALYTTLDNITTENALRKWFLLATDVRSLVRSFALCLSVQSINSICAVVCRANTQLVHTSSMSLFHSNDFSRAQRYNAVNIQLYSTVRYTLVCTSI